ncbi:MAG: DUF429 domain-containing protein [Verrucomicrobiota bacterium]
MHDEKPKAPAGVGIDGCHSGWLAVILDKDGKVRSRCEPELGFLLALLPATVLIDMPIGLPSAREPARLCDRLARKLLGKGATSRVFSPPIREILGESDYAAACARSRELTGKAISKQAYNIMPKIRQLDAALRVYPELQPQVRESHPEVCFARLAGQTMPPKKDSTGIRARLACLKTHWPNAEAAFTTIRSCYGRTQVADDDIVDAMVLAWVAVQAPLVSLPEVPPRDACDLPMQIVCPV